MPKLLLLLLCRHLSKGDLVSKDKVSVSKVCIYFSMFTCEKLAFFKFQSLKTPMTKSLFFHRIYINERVKRRQLSLFLHENIIV